MLDERLQPRPLYGIGTVARLTGVKQDTLRVWERRYRLGASYKSPTGRRQYTQGDLEHLQLIAALVANGTRIGEIASSERKTLEMLLQARGASGPGRVPDPKPRVVFVGEFLCDWLDEHQGCLSNVDAILAKVSPTEVSDDLMAGLGPVDALVLGCSSLSNGQMAAMTRLRSSLSPCSVLVVYQYGNDNWLQELEHQQVQALAFPPDPAQLAFHLTQSVVEKVGAAGATNLGELVPGRPRIHSEEQLSAARQLQGNLDCECPRHITDLIRALANFENYSASCSVENWQDAAVHSCIYAYAGQARWLMEKSLNVVLGHHEVIEQCASDRKLLDEASA